jgi:hypothetical protein
MRLAVVAALSLMFVTPAFATPAVAMLPPDAAPIAASASASRQPVAMHYRTLGKMLRRFAAQAGTASSGKVYASR